MIRFKVILYNQEGEVVYQNKTTKKRGRVVWAVNNHEWHSAYLKVLYEEYKTLNDGWYYSVENLLFALKAFTESWLLDALAGKETED